MKYNNDDNKKIAELYYNLYIDCMKYKDTKKLTNEGIDCDIYLNNFKFIFEKYCNGKEQNS
jgi:hypothetical protein